MTGITCPRCKAKISTEDVNVREGAALCRGCSCVFKMSEISESADLLAVDTSQTPAGCAIQDDGVETVFRVSVRSAVGAIGLVFVCLFWNGIVSVFVMLALASTLSHLGVTPGSWMPAKMAKGSGMSLAMTLFLWVFLTPFIAVGLAMIAGLFLAIAGHVHVRIRGDVGEVFTGVGAIGRTQRFDPNSVTRVELREIRDSEGATTKHIRIEAGKTIKFGSGMPHQRQLWLAAVLREVLQPRPTPERCSARHAA